MISNMPNSFFGNKKYLISWHDKLQQRKSITDQEIREIFEPYSTSKVWRGTQDGTNELGLMFAQFIRGNLLKFSHWPFEKLSAWIQLSAHNHLSKKQSFQYFSQILVRHSLFRPPHCVNVFNYEDSKQIMRYWLQTFVRFYEEYSQCFQSELNEILYSISPQPSPDEAVIQTRKQISRLDFISKFGSIIQIKEVDKKNN